MPDALPAALPPDALAFFGEPLKVLGTYTKNGTEHARLGGYLVRFSGPADPDLEGDYFTAATDFGTLSRKGAATLPAYYQHGFDPVFRNKAIGDADVSLDEFGVWAEYQIELRTEYERHLVAMAEAGKLGQSSGAVSHLVERRAVGKSYHFEAWPLGEASLTPTPAEPRTSAMPLKAFQAWAAAQAAPVALTAKVIAGDVPASPSPDPTPAAMSDIPQAAPAADFIPAPPDSPAVLAAIAAIDAQIKGMREDAKPAPDPALSTKGAPVFIARTGDTEAKALGAFIRNADRGGVKHALIGDNEVDLRALKTSNDTDLNITTAADGGRLVPVGHYQGIIAKMNETRLQLGVLDIPGSGTTVNVPTQTGTTNRFVTTAEAVANDRDAPAFGQVAMTLLKYTKRVELTDELMQDEDSRLIAFLDRYVGDAAGLTHNNLLLAEVLANGTQLRETASTTVVAAGELETAVFGDAIARYLGGGANWVMRPSTYARIIALTGNERLYAPTTQGTGANLAPTILGYPVQWDSGTVPAYGTQANKFALFGNFSYVGRREGNLSLLRDPYSGAGSGVVRLHYAMRTVYKVLQAEAVGFIQHDAT